MHRRFPLAIVAPIIKVTATTMIANLKIVVLTTTMEAADKISLTTTA